MDNEREKPYVLHQRGMADRTKRVAQSNLDEDMEIIRQCEEAALEISDKFPIAARLLQQEAQLWRGL